MKDESGKKTSRIALRRDVSSSQPSSSDVNEPCPHVSPSAVPAFVPIPMSFARFHGRDARLVQRHRTIPPHSLSRLGRRTDVMAAREAWESGRELVGPHRHATSLAARLWQTRVTETVARRMRHTLKPTSKIESPNRAVRGTAALLTYGSQKQIKFCTEKGR
jgi:hypothetical protein